MQFYENIMKHHDLTFFQPNFNPPGKISIEDLNFQDCNNFPLTLGTFPKEWQLPKFTKWLLPKQATSQMCNFPKCNYPSCNFPSLSQQQRSASACSNRGARPPFYSLRRLRGPYLTFGKLPLGKLHIWEVATWEIVIWEVALGKMPLGKYLTPNSSLFPLRKF